MKSLQLSLLIALILLFANIVVGQTPDVFWRQNNVANGSGSAVSITQIGGNNQLTYLQQTIGAGGGNEAQFRQQGQGNRMEVGLLGNNSRFAASQIGNQNVLSLPNIQALNAEVQVVQRGDGNQLIRQGTLAVGVPMLIEQTGGMRLILTNTGQ